MLSAEDIERYLHEIDVRLTIREAPVQKAPAWKAPGDDHGIHYVITFKREGQIFRYNFWNSIYDRDHGRELTPTDIIENLLSDRYCPDTLEDFCSDYGVEESDPKSKRTFKAVFNHSEKINAFFSEEELEQLASDEPLPVPPERGEIHDITGYDESVIAEINRRLQE